ncbi:MAG: hypothetical protein ACKO1J_07060 [Tagaea sp.]
MDIADFVDAVAGADTRSAALGRLLAIALEAAGVAPLSEEEILAEVKAVRRETREKRAFRS